MSGCYDYAYSNVEDFAYSMLHSNCTIRQAFGLHLYRISQAMKVIEWVDSADLSAPEDIKAIREVLKYIKDDNSLSSGSGD